LSNEKSILSFALNLFSFTRTTKVVSKERDDNHISKDVAPSILSQDVTVGLAISQLLPLVDKPSFLDFHID
jgi:hypothetical protein